MLKLTFTYTAKGARPHLAVYFNKSSKVTTIGTVGPDVTTEIEVPATAALTVFQCVAAYKSGWGQIANVLEGKAYIKNDGTKGKVELRNRLHPGRVSGYVTYEFTKAPNTQKSFPNVIEVGESYCPGHKNEMHDLYRRNKLWWTDGRLKPKSKIVGRIHTSKFNRMILPGWTFMLDDSPSHSDVNVFESAIKNVLLRRNFQGQLERENSQFKSIVVAEAVQAIANMIQYTTDYEYSTSNAEVREEYDEFISSARNNYLRAGDCEDLAKEMHMLIREIQLRTWPAGTLTGLCAPALRQYMSAIVLGSMMAAKAGMADVAPTGHAFLALFPKAHVSEKLDKTVKILESQSSDNSINSADVVYEELNLLILDGTNLKPVEFGDIMFPQPAIHSTSRLKHEVYRKAMISEGEMRVRTYIPRLSYVDCVSILVNDIVTIKEETPVYQLYLRQGDRYGVDFSNINQTNVSIVPCMVPSKADIMLCRMGLELEPPIQGYKQNKKKQAPMQTVKAWHSESSTPIQLFIQTVDHDITEAIIKHKELFDGVYVREERFADGVVGDRIIICL